jgi:hypothetical protein
MSVNLSIYKGFYFICFSLFMSSGPPINTNIFATTQEINDKLDALLRRPTPATQAELAQFGEFLKTTLARQQAEAAQLTKTVQTLLQPIMQFNETALAQRLTAAISPQLPTPAGLTQAGEQAAQAIRQVVQMAVNQATNSIQAFSRQAAVEVQVSARQLTDAAGGMRQVVETVPKSVRIDFMGAKRDVAIVAAVGGVFTLLVASFFYAWAGGFKKVDWADYQALQKQAYQSELNLNTMYLHRERLRKDNPAIAYKYFPFNNDPAPVAKPKPTPPKSGRKHRR